MSGLSGIPNHPGAPAARALHQADEGIGGWLTGLVTGSGSSPSQIIITGILGVVPGLGQAMDARDLILGIIVISRSPTAIGAWVELCITLIGCVPAIGDACKVGLKLMKEGHNFGRVLEAVSPAVRGNVEKYVRKIDWDTLVKQSQALLSKSLAAFIDGIDCWAVKAVAGKSEVAAIIAELKDIQKRGPKMVDDAFAALKDLHAKMLGHELPGTTAALGGTSRKVAKEEAAAAAGAVAAKEAKAAAKQEKKLLPKKSRDVEGSKAQPSETRVDKKKAAEKKEGQQRNARGILAEHLTDYYVKRKHPGYPKANQFGRLTEARDTNRHGLDHLWYKQGHVERPFIVGETKSSLFDSLGLIMALPADLRKQFEQLRENEQKNPLPNNDPDKRSNPDIFASTGRDDLANQHVTVEGGKEEVIKKGMNKPNEKTGLLTQMSHAWILAKLEEEKLTTQGKTLNNLLREHRRQREQNQTSPFPYHRWVSLVTGRQFAKHSSSKGDTHDIQVMLDLPDGILEK